MLVFLQERIPESGNPLLGRQSGGTGTDGRVAVPATRKAASSRGRRPPETTGADSNVDSGSVGATVTLEIGESVSCSIGQHLSLAPLRRIDRRWSKSGPCAGNVDRLGFHEPRNNRIAANSPSKITDRDCPISFFPRQIYAWPLVAAIESRVTERFIGEMWHRLRDR